MANVLALFKNITCFVFDVDGVLTDGSLLVLPDGVMARRMNIKDGYALQLAIKKGYKIIVISGGRSAEVKQRLEKLGVKDVYMEIEDKVSLLSSMIEKASLQPEEILCMGDDIPDLQMMNLAGLRCCPVDAVTEIKELSQYISPVKGGDGCARDVIEKVMKLRGDWTADVSVKAQ